MNKNYISTVFLLSSLMLFSLMFSEQAAAESNCDALWEERIVHLEKTYKEKFSKLNNMRLYFKTSHPDATYGPSCRVIDLSTAEKIKSWRQTVSKLRKEITGGEKPKGGYLVKRPWHFWPYKKFIKNYKKGMKENLPPGVSKLMPQLLKSCANYDYCKKQKKNENIMFVFPAECILGFKVPTGSYETKTHLLYLFLISEERANQLASF